MGEAVALWEGERPLPRHPPPRTCAPSICSKTPAIFPPSPLEVPWTDSHPRVTGIPLTALPFTTLQIQTSALMWRLPTGLIETRPSGSQPPSVSPNGDWLLLHPHGVPLIRTSLLPWWRPKASRFSSLSATLPSGFQLGLEARWGTPCQPSRPSERPCLKTFSSQRPLTPWVRPPLIL